MTQSHEVSDLLQSLKQVVRERDEARAEVERLKAYSEAADKALELACKTRSAAVDVLKIVNIQRDKWMERAEKATAERDRLAGLLCDAGICLLSKDEGRQVSMAAQIDAALAEVGKS